MKRSKRNNPCPACGRTKDSDCAWADDVIFCHTGSDLSIGQTIDIDDRPWALVKLNAGFSGNAAVFKPHREDYKPQGLSQGQLLSHQAKRSVSAFAIERFFAAFDKAWAVLDFHSLSADELQDGINAIEKAQRSGADLAKGIQCIWRDHHDLAELHRERFEACQKNLKLQIKDLNDFRTFYLGEVVK